MKNSSASALAGKAVYVAPKLSVKGDIATLTQGKSWGSGDSFILSIDAIPDDIANIIDNITHYS